MLLLILYREFGEGGSEQAREAGWEEKFGASRIAGARPILIDAFLVQRGWLVGWLGFGWFRQEKLRLLRIGVFLGGSSSLCYATSPNSSSFASPVLWIALPIVKLPLSLSLSLSQPCLY